MSTSIRAGAILVCAVMLGGCTYLETQMQRTAPPDTRIQLEERRFLSAREIPKYTCGNGYLLRCDGVGAARYSCTCMLK